MQGFNRPVGSKRQNLRRNGGLKEGELSWWWLLPDLNWGHKALQASALPTELKSHNIYSDYIGGVSSMQHLWYNCFTAWRLGGAVTQRSAKPCRWVQLPQVPPSLGEWRNW